MKYRYKPLCGNNNVVLGGGEVINNFVSSKEGIGIFVVLHHYFGEKLVPLNDVL